MDAPGKNKFEGLSDHDLLLQLANDTCWIKKILGNHLEHHKAITVALIAITGTAIIALLIAIVNLV
jgi:hypothetical protein